MLTAWLAVWRPMPMAPRPAIRQEGCGAGVRSWAIVRRSRRATLAHRPVRARSRRRHMAACLAEAGRGEILGIDPDPAVAAAVAQGRAPVREPGLDALLRRGVTAGRLAAATAPGNRLRGLVRPGLRRDAPNPRAADSISPPCAT